MRILWLTNIPIPALAKDANLPPTTRGGWLEGYANGLGEYEDLSLIYLFPNARHCEGNFNGIMYETFDSGNIDTTKKCFREVIKKHRPDIVHVFGTEYPHSRYMLEVVKEFGLQSRTIVSIQGLVSCIARHYTAFLPSSVVHSMTFRDFIKRDSIRMAQKEYEKRGKHEIKTLEMASHVIGRTDWDYACVKQINPNIQYHFCNEILRASFYEGKWSYDDCEKHSIFTSQAWYPLKGFHLMLEAFALIKKKYPDAKLYTTGKSVFTKSFKEKLKERSYSLYLKKLIKKYGLEESVVFTGSLTEENMKARYLRSHVFVSPSSIENSSNSVGEAMILGVPTVSSDVGGIRNLLRHGEEGFLYPADEPYMIAYYADRIFSDRELADRLSEKAKARAEETHSREKNTAGLFEIYRDIMNQPNTNRE